MTDKAAPVAEPEGEGDRVEMVEISIVAAPGHGRGDLPGGNRGVTLPSGWLPMGAAEAVSAVGALAWTLRQVRYRPGALVGAERHDPDLTALASTVAFVRHALHSPATPYRARGPQAAEQPDADFALLAAAGGDVMASPVDVEAAGGGDALAILGVRDSAPLTPAGLPPGGIGLVGPGAIGAARAIVMAALTAGGLLRPAAHVYTTQADLGAVFGPASAWMDVLPRLTVHGGVDAALAALSSRLPRTGEVTPQGRAGLDEGPVILVLESPAGPAADLLAAYLSESGDEATAVLIGMWPSGATWHVHADGNIRTDPAAPTTRLAVLDPAAAVDILTTLRAAHTRNHGAAPAPPTAAIPVAFEPTLTRVAAPAPLTLRVLGAPTLQHTDAQRQPVRVRRSAGVEILLYLAVHRRGATTDELMEAIWPDVARSSAARRLQVTMSELRQALHTAAAGEVIRQTPAADGAEAGQTRHWLDAGRIEVDLWHLRDAADAAATAIDPTERADALRTVIAAYTGELAQGHGYEWLHREREATLRIVVDAYAHLAEDEPDDTRALDLLQAAIRRAPRTEALYQLAIARYLAAGDRAGVTRVVDTLAGQLRPLGLRPSEQTRHLAGDAAGPAASKAAGDSDKRAR